MEDFFREKLSTKKAKFSFFHLSLRSKKLRIHQLFWTMELSIPLHTHFFSYTQFTLNALVRCCHWYFLCSQINPQTLTKRCSRKLVLSYKNISLTSTPKHFSLTLNKGQSRLSWMFVSFWSISLAEASKFSSSADLQYQQQFPKMGTSVFCFAACPRRQDWRYLVGKHNGWCSIWSIFSFLTFYNIR